MKKSKIVQRGVNMDNTSFYSREELKKIGFKKFGENVQISKFARFYNPHKMTIGSNVRIDDFVIISAVSEEITIGNYVHIAAYCALFGAAGLVMEDFSGLSSRVTIYTASDDYQTATLTNPTVPQEFRKIKSGKVILKKHVIIGGGSVILPKVIIGEGTSIGALTVVREELEAWGVFYGPFCKKIGKRAKEILWIEKKFLEQKNGGL
jgi:galactoside O-acetyltransferase